MLNIIETKVDNSHELLDPGKDFLNSSGTMIKYDTIITVNKWYLMKL